VSFLSEFDNGWEKWFQLLNDTVTAWRYGNDQAGLIFFVRAMECLSAILERVEENQVENHFAELSYLLPVLQELDKKIDNEDIIAITDMIEFKLIPLEIEWGKRVAQ
jgi:hypothetical protein